MGQTRFVFGLWTRGQTYLARSHHHTTTDGIKRVRSNTGTGGDTPAEQERGQEVTLERTDQENRLDGVVQAEVETTVNHDSKNRRTETTVETSNTIGSQSLAVHIDQAVELTFTTLGCGFGIVGKTSTKSRY